MAVEPTALPSRPSPGAAGARLGELYREHARMVLGVCRLVLRDPSESEDATQQVFLSAYRSLLTGTRVDKPGAWLATIARNECRARLQARSLRPVPHEELATVPGPGIDEQVEGRELNARLYAELAALPVKQREAVVLRDVHGLRYDEVATVLGTSRAAVETLLFRGRRRLQSRLRPRLAATVLVVPLALRESLAHAVPGFAATAAAPVAGGSAVAVPLVAKLVATGLAVGAVGTAGVATQSGDGVVPRAQAGVVPTQAQPSRKRLQIVLPPLPPQPRGPAVAAAAPAPPPAATQERAQPSRGERSGSNAEDGEHEHLGAADAADAGEHGGSDERGAAVEADARGGALEHDAQAEQGDDGQGRSDERSNEGSGGDEQDGD